MPSRATLRRRLRDLEEQIRDDQEETRVDITVDGEAVTVAGCFDLTREQQERARVTIKGRPEDVFEYIAARLTTSRWERIRGALMQMTQGG